jgi:hypothetical protein
MEKIFEYDFCTEHGRHALRTDGQEETRRTLLNWGALSLPVESALGIEVGQRCQISLGNGCSSVIERIR